MDLPALIAQFGYIAVFLGTVFEGEAVLLLAGYSAHRGYLDFAPVVAVAMSGAVLGDLTLFWLGRRHGQRLITRRPGMHLRAERALGLIERTRLPSFWSCVSCGDCARRCPLPSASAG
jgi:membrane protein DedA with SNARE-associated domain